MTDLRSLFDEVVALIRDTPVTTDLAVSNEDKLRMYGLYKQATVGSCPEDTVPPPLWQPTSRAKYESWVSYRQVDSSKAMLNYVQVAARQNHWLGHKCCDLLKKYEQRHENVATRDADAVTAIADASFIPLHREGSTVDHRPLGTIPVDQNPRSPQSHIINRLFGLKPLMPRGQLDITYAELAKAALFCLESSSAPIRDGCEAEICTIWKQQYTQAALKDHSVVVGLSARSLFDLYLRARSFPPGSEVIVSPPINIPAMIRILEHHDIKIVAVDLPKSFTSDLVLRIDLDQVQRSVTANTVAIMVVHPFGIETTTENDMNQLRALADERGLDVIEDCAECYAGGKSTRRSYADLALYSFGPMKTATALGGGVAVVRDNKVSAKMNRLHQSLYEPQTQVDFLWNVIKAAVVQFVAGSPSLYAMVYAACRCLGLDFDRVVFMSTRNFSLIQTRNPATLIRSIRRRPSLGLLKSLLMRLTRSKDSESLIRARIQRCENMMVKLQVYPLLRWPKAVTTHCWWLAPIVVESPDDTSQRLLQLGYDVPRGLSQLQCIGDSPRAKAFMQSILYLPVSSRSMSESDSSSLAHAISIAINSSAPIRTEHPLLLLRWNKPISCCMVVVILLPMAYASPLCLQLVKSIALFALASHVLNLGVCCLLTFFLADLYMESSGCFAKHNPMLRRMFEPDGQERDSQHAGLDDMPAIRMSRFSTVDDNKPCILLTGATGFLGSSILYQLLANRDMLESIDRIIVICRPKRGKSASERIHELLDQEMFAFFATDQRDTKFLVLEGDTSKADAGLSRNDLTHLCANLKVQAVINCAASVRFTLPLDKAAAHNITSAMHLHSLAQKLNTKLVHISTAFVHGGTTGTNALPLTEMLFSLGKFDAEKIYKSMIGNQMYASLAMSTLGFHNTYTFSKCISEHLLLQASNDDVVIIRPSIIGPALEEPFEGWAGQRPSTVVAATCLYLKFPFSMWSFGNHEAAIIPVDVVSRFVLARACHNGCSESLARLTSPSESSSHTSSEFERVSPIGEVESLSSDSASTAMVSKALEGSLPVIFNAAWNSDSSKSSSFSWLDFAASVPHLGSVLGSCSRVTAYIAFAVSIKILPSLHLKPEQFAFVYYAFVQAPFGACLHLTKVLSLTATHRKLSAVLSFLDLPVLFYPFINNSFVFESLLQAPQHLDGQRYMFSCIAAAHRFVYENPMSLSERIELYPRDTSNILIGGKHHRLNRSDLWWALTQPLGSMFIRLAGLLFVKILRCSCTEVSVDAESFAEVAKTIASKDEKMLHVVLAPTHRSFYDFILISFLAFSLPELKIKIPHIAAAQEFSNLPFFGWMIEHINAFFVKRGRGRDPDLAEQLHRIKGGSKRHGACIEVFIEGSRSRDRRFLPPKTGFIRCLVHTGGDHVVVPICINYERVPEQDALAREGFDGNKQVMRVSGLLPWFWNTLTGKLPLGNIHIAAAKPMLINEQSDIKFDSLVSEIQLKQQSLIRISAYHVKGAELVLGLSSDVIKGALLDLGCSFWPSVSPMREGPTNFNATSLSEAWSVTMQFGHLVAPQLKESQSFWADWLCPFKLTPTIHAGKSELIAKLVCSFEDMFDSAEGAVNQALQELQDLGICRLSRQHVVHIARRIQHRVPDELLHAYASMKVIDSNLPTQIDATFRRDLHVGNEDEELGMWGFKDSRFLVRPDTHGRPSVVMTGSRYRISGKPLKKLIPFIEGETKTSIDVFKEPVGITGLDLCECALSTDEIESIKDIVSRISIASGARARHGTGHSHEEAYQLRRHGRIRVPDIVVWPSSEGEVESLIQKAKECSWNLIPHGGGTNVSQSTKCPAKIADPRPIISVDMTALKRILYVNEEDGIAHVEAGIIGRELIEQLGRRGYTIGHEPDSLEFSTLGGWIATKASGMKRSKYGNIEGIVVDIRVAGSAGLIWQGTRKDATTAIGRQSRGPDLLSLFLGSEGCLGIITSAVIRIWPTPPVQRYDSIIFRDFNVGLQFAQGVSKLGSFMPASVRLLDNTHFRLGQALREEPSLLEVCGRQVLKLLSPSFRSMSGDATVCATILFEGYEDEVRAQHQRIKSLATQYGGFFAGPGVGQSGYELTYVIAYLRDFALSFNFLGDSFETFAPWSKVKEVVTATKARIKEEHALRRLPGEVFVGCRVTQLYHDGACLYFYMCMYCGNINDASSVFTEIENLARQEILQHGGSLSHHHGVGKMRAEFLQEMDSKALRDGLLALKRGIDPENIFGAGNGAFASS